MHVSGLLLSIIGIVGAVSWLLLLVATNFNGVTIGAGVLAALYATGRRA